MTEAEWLASSSPALMVLSVPLSQRKLRLFAIACSRQAVHLTQDLTLQNAIELAEEYADGKSTKALLADRERRVQEHLVELRTLDPDAHCIVMGDARVHPYGVGRGVADCLSSDAKAAASKVPLRLASTAGTDPDDPSYEKVLKAFARMAREIFGNPFRQITADPSWLTSTVMALASGIYEERAFDRMPILADALEEAGCDNESILTYCRGSGPHVRGCWVVDLLTNRE